MGKFRLQRLRGGRTHVLITDSAADYLRCLIDEMAGDFNVLCHVSVTELAAAAAGAGPASAAARAPAAGPASAVEWMRVQVERAPEASLLDRASEFRFGEFADELNHVFGKFYDSDPGAAERGTLNRSWTVRHRRGCPWI